MTETVCLLWKRCTQSAKNVNYEAHRRRFIPSIELSVAQILWIERWKKVLARVRPCISEIVQLLEVFKIKSEKGETSLLMDLTQVIWEVLPFLELEKCLLVPLCLYPEKLPVTFCIPRSQRVTFSCYNSK